MRDYFEQQRLNKMPRAMTIAELREELDRLDIKYTFYDCHIGNNNEDFILFNTQVICPVGYSLDNAIYATDKNNWFVLNNQCISVERINDFIDFQGSSEYLELNTLSELRNHEIKLHQATDNNTKNLISFFNYSLAKLLLRENITDKTFNGMLLKDYIENQKQTFKEMLGREVTPYNENYIGALLFGYSPTSCLPQEVILNTKEQEENQRLDSNQESQVTKRFNRRH